MNAYFTEERINRLNNEAEEKGYKVKEFINADKVTYTRLKCGHEFTFNPCSMRHQKRSLCRECNDLKFDAVIKEKQVQLIKKINTYTFKIIVNKCKHEITTSIHNLSKTQGAFKCPVCMVEDFHDRCKELNVDVLENPANQEEVANYASPKKYAKFLRRYCGHTFICLRHNLLSMRTCDVCIQNAKTEKLTNNGYEFVNKTDSNVKSLYRFKSCGHTRVLFDVAALRGNAVCHICNNTSNTAKSKLYIIQFKTDGGFEFIKFGYGKNIKNRVREYSLKNTMFVSTLFEMDIATGNEARIIENSIHKSLNEFRLPNDTMKAFLTRTGYSECYPLNLLDEIKLRIHNKCSSG